MDLHEKATPPREFVTDEFGYADGLLDDDEDSISAWDAADEIRRLRADVTTRRDKELKRFSHTIKANFAGNVTLAAQRDPRIRAIVSKYTSEFEAIDAAELRYLKAEAMDHANKPWVRQANRDRARGHANLQDFARDLRPGRLLETPRAGRATDEAFMFGQPGSVFGSDRELWRKSSVARSMNFNSYPGDEKSQRW